MNKKAIALLVVALLLVGGAVTAWMRRPAKEERLTFSGTVEARDVEVGSLLGGRVSVVHVREGQTVTAGQSIVTFETDLVDEQVEEQQAQLAAVEASLAKAVHGPREEEKARARAQWDDAEKERRRLDTLLHEGIVPRQQYDDVVAKAQVMRQTLAELEKGSRPEDIQAARASRDAAQQRLDYLRRQRQESVVTAPAAGTVEALDLRPGDLVAAGRPVATLLEPDQMWVRVYVPEPKLGLVHLDQGAHLTVDSYPGREFAGRVVEIRQQAEYSPRNIQTLDQRSEQVFGVKVEVARAPELKPGMAALVRLEP